DWQNGRSVMLGGQWAAFGVMWIAASRLNPPLTIHVLHPFAADGGKPVYYLGAGNVGSTGIKKARADRVKEVLGILNFAAAPFGSQEGLLLDYGVEGEEFTFDANGNPKQTDKGPTDMLAPWRYMTAHPSVLYDPTLPNYAQTL